MSGKVVAVAGRQARNGAHSRRGGYPDQSGRIGRVIEPPLQRAEVGRLTYPKDLAVSAACRRPDRRRSRSPNLPAITAEPGS